MDKLPTFFFEAKPFFDGWGSLFDFGDAVNSDMVFDVSTERDEWQRVADDFQTAIDELEKAQFG